jgi:hypothetical protein
MTSTSRLQRDGLRAQLLHGPSADRAANSQFGRRGVLIIFLARRRYVGRSPCSEPSGDHACRWPRSVTQSPQRLSPSPARVRSRPVVRGRQPPVLAAPAEHRLDHAFTGPTALDGTGVAVLAIGIRIALSVARLRVGAAAPTCPDVTRLDRPRLLASRVPSVYKALASIRSERSQHAEEGQRRRRGSCE